MANKKIFIVTEDMPEYLKWQIAKKIAELIINASVEERFFIKENENLTIVASEKEGPKLRKEIEEKTNALLLDNYKIEIKNPRRKQTKIGTQFVSVCSIEIV